MPVSRLLAAINQRCDKRVSGSRPALGGGRTLLLVTGFLDGYAHGRCGRRRGAGRGVRGLKLHAAHFVDRHGLVIVMALGESITAIGPSGHEFFAQIVLGALLAVALSSTLAWIYFDYIERRTAFRPDFPAF